MHSPLSMQDAAHLRDASGPSPLRTMSSTPLMMSPELVSAMPAGFTLGQTSTHLPHRVQASSMSSTRWPRAVSKEISLFGCIPASPINADTHAGRFRLGELSPNRLRRKCEAVTLSVLQKCVQGSDKIQAVVCCVLAAYNRASVPRFLDQEEVA